MISILSLTQHNLLRTKLQTVSRDFVTHQRSKSLKSLPNGMKAFSCSIYSGDSVSESRVKTIDGSNLSDSYVHST